MVTLADRLKLLRKSKQMTQSDLGKILGVGKTTVSMYENGNSTPNDQIKFKIAEYFDISLDYLLGKSDSHNANTEIKLNEKDKLNIQKDLKNIMDDYREQKDGTKYYNGVELKDEDFDFLEIAMQIALEKIKVTNKDKYTPNKFKK